MTHYAPTFVITAGGFWLAGSNWGRRLTEYETIAAFLGICAVAALLTLLGA